MLSKKYRDFKRLVVYQIYPRSFMDTNGDGIGDLQGVISKLDYIQSLGANAIWLSPCFKSPNEDNGYDVADYEDIMDEFGTMEDMDHLIDEMHSRGMKLFLDLVPNHTSTQHRWFQESRKGKDNPYSDYYYWFDEKPNDWKSAFEGSAWEYDEMRGQYYLHTFAVGQADLNWDNPAVVKEMQGVIDFWTDKGIDGFRIDVIDCVSKDLINDKNGFGPRLHEYIHAMFGRDNVSHLFTVGEGAVHDIEEMKRHCAEDRGELSTLFIFEHMDCGRSDKFTPNGEGLESLRDVLVKWQNTTAENELLYPLFIENHDQPQLMSRIADDKSLRYESATDIAAMVYLLDGVPFIYQGQEFGMAAAHYDDISCFDDVECLGAYREMLDKYTPEKALEKVNFGSRDNARHPMTWDSSEYGGFSDSEPWLCIHSRKDEINAAKDMSSEKSVFRFYQQLLKLRKENAAFLDGSLDVISKPGDDFFIYTRALGDSRWAVVCNFKDHRDISLPFKCKAPALANLGRDRADGVYAPYECSISEIVL